ncbi:MAG TPA: CcoQ/FixQ family Cbb3-type cytochrome c oxidase assembly chaperone [Thiobacillaceae bacterium]|nr:CcoQ/FixQ family Cbb3-type cytochrome c oxidase assembly chaperone [Thiobacillaceae bacterium]HNA81237.1 CcoQ/FixQ family Cbb3-type cytochrome c oxidase assembly chaperone [Thiobacillaceae bacterium]HNF89140.1 CcoQ/FixQ family Cbb3-type cytochrome c oxidase assembly chaperone [Thiobacillaceae bacterium]HNH87937.1 CcoQ/FixQ family Cbb3-type cytochrome c oxidase assembly chaperone [Thiobacillaceae bacterium]HNI07466.1 CcoQ/FixQ family Cbb3-type cytochrome c oxidase assembly chaperone [Thiobaci
MDYLINMLSEYGLFLGIPLVFLAVVAWVYRPGATQAYREDADLPFLEDERPRPPQS